MKVLFVGGTNYFGKIAVRKLLERGEEVWIYSRGGSKPDFWKDVRHVEGDRTDHEGFERKLRGEKFDVVFDNIAYNREDVECAVRTFRNTAGKYVFTSTVSVYGGGGHNAQHRTVRNRHQPAELFQAVDLDKCVPIREEDLDLCAIGWDYPEGLHPYAVGKRHGEKVLGETKDFSYVSLRVPPVLGPDDPTLRIYWYIQRVLDGGEILLPDGGHNVFRNMYSHDVADAMIAAGESDRTRPGPYNLGQAEIMTQRRLVLETAQAAGREVNVVSIPRDLVESQTEFPYESLVYDSFSRPQSYLMDIEKARAHFGMTSTPQLDWLRTTVAWYQDEYRGEDSEFYEHRNQEMEFARDFRRRFRRVFGSEMNVARSR
ncbi:MAG: NAD-dependent epimerase/dehydratase family protein [Armatimonadetes bacterium]|nr:NAD-dependent epimerase/dehydratase family protein [Armatimonadota bacterium]